jgi:N-sulfoglucosamine sulfohydrolase
MIVRHHILNRREFLAASITGAASAQAAKPLNILLVVADDLGPVLSCYGETLIQTPHLDRLAASGVQFKTACVAQASCSPSRSAIFTGLHTHSTGQYGLANSGLSLHPELRDRTIPNILKTAGYRTGIIGKLHVEPEASFQFDYRPGSPGETRKVRWTAQRADEFLRQNGSGPFFLMVNYADPHAFRNAEAQGGWNFPPQVDGLPESPLPPGEKTIFRFQQIDTPEQRVRTAGYYNAVQRLDTGIGMLLDVLRKHDREKDTLVIFIGDHGPPFCRGKTTVYESGVRIPFLVRWPGVSRPMKSDAMVSTIDILPTILDAARVKSPGKVHGSSLRPVVSNPRGKWREYLVTEFHMHGIRPFYPRRAIRDQRYKLIHNLLARKQKPSPGIDGDFAYKFSRDSRYDGTDVRRAFDTFADPPEFELYDLETDPVEFHNFAGQPAHRSTEQRLAKALMDYRRETGDPFLDPAAIQKMVDYSVNKQI